jgi:DNA-binding response OmpR family regulator
MLPIKILIISADDSMANSIINSLSQAGYKVIHTQRGVDAIDLIRAKKPTLVILNRELPDYNSTKSPRAGKHNCNDYS